MRARIRATAGDRLRTADQQAGDWGRSPETLRSEHGPSRSPSRSRWAPARLPNAEGQDSHRRLVAASKTAIWRAAATLVAAQFMVELNECHRPVTVQMILPAGTAAYDVTNPGSERGQSCEYRPACSGWSSQLGVQRPRARERETWGASPPRRERSSSPPRASWRFRRRRMPGAKW